MPDLSASDSGTLRARSGMMLEIFFDRLTFELPTIYSQGFPCIIHLRTWVFPVYLLVEKRSVISYFLVFYIDLLQDGGFLLCYKGLECLLVEALTIIWSVPCTSVIKIYSPHGRKPRGCDCNEEIGDYQENGGTNWWPFFDMAFVFEICVGMGVGEEGLCIIGVWSIPHPNQLYW